MDVQSFREKSRRVLEGPLFWGVAALGITIFVSVVVAMRHDVRWLLVFTWPCILIMSWEIARGFGARLPIRWSVLAVTGIFSAVLLWAVYDKLAPISTLPPDSAAIEENREQPLVLANPVLSGITDDTENGKQFTSKPLSYFKDIWQKENPVQFASLSEPYLGLLIKFSGKLDNQNITQVDKDYFSVGINFEGGDVSGGMLIVCRYPFIYRNYLARLESGQLLEGVGTIAKLSPIGMELNGCHPR